MERTGLIAKLFRFADALIGWLPGGFAYATILAAVMFGAISGSSTAMAAAMGVVAYPEMIKRGYPKWMAAGVIATGGGIAILIPPSITLILYGVLTDESIVKLFFAGVIPGLMLAFSDAVIVLTMAAIIKLPAAKFSWSELWSAGIDALPALLMPVFVLGALYGGVLTPTESGAGACAYAMAYGFLSMRGRFVKEMLAATERAVNLTAILFFLLGGVGIFQFLLANQGWPQDIAEWVTGMGLSPIGFLAVSDGRAAVPVDVPDRGRDPGSRRADHLPGVAVARHRPDPPRRAVRAVHRDGRSDPAGRPQPVRGQRHDRRAGHHRDARLVPVPVHGRLRFDALHVLPDPDAVAAEHGGGQRVQLMQGIGRYTGRVVIGVKDARFMSL